MSGVSFHRLDRDRVVEQLKAWAAGDLASRSEVQEVILIGSLARGDWSARSDADVVVVVDRAQDPGPFRGQRYVPSMSMGVGLDIFVYTPDELARTSVRFRAEVARGLVIFTRSASRSDTRGTRD